MNHIIEIFGGFTPFLLSLSLIAGMVLVAAAGVRHARLEQSEVMSLETFMLLDLTLPDDAIPTPSRVAVSSMEAVVDTADSLRAMRVIQEEKMRSGSTLTRCE